MVCHPVNQICKCANFQCHRSVFQAQNADCQSSQTMCKTRKNTFDAHTCPNRVVSTGPYSWQRNSTFCCIDTLHIHVFTNFLGHGGNNLGRALQVLLSDPIRIEMYIVQFQCNPTQIYMFTLSIYMFSQTSLVIQETNPDVHCRFCFQILYE